MDKSGDECTKINFISYKQFLADILSLAKRIPKDIDMVFGVPRSGLIPATMIALHLNVPMGIPGVSFQMGGKRVKKGMEHVEKVLLVEDSCNGGGSIKRALEKLKNKPYMIYTAAVYIRNTQCRRIVDYWHKIIPKPRFFEWNIFHHVYLGKCCLDFDGVLCEDPTKEQNDDGMKYTKFIRTAKPLHLPTVPIKYIVTSRLEKYRSHTLYWLKKHKIKFEKLIMLDLPDAKTRRKLRIHAKFKADFYKKCDSPLFIESNEGQAKQIFKITKKPVLSLQSMRLYQ